MSHALYRDMLGFRVAEQDPNHGDLFMTLGEDFHTLDLAQYEGPETAGGRSRSLGVAHIAFQVASYEARGEAYRALLQHGVRIERAMDHVNQRSIYFLDPDGNRLEIYYEMPGALARFPEGRGDQNRELARQRLGRATARLTLRAVAPQLARLARHQSSKRSRRSSPHLFPPPRRAATWGRMKEGELNGA